MNFLNFKIKVVWVSGSVSQMSVKSAGVSGSGGHRGEGPQLALGLA